MEIGNGSENLFGLEIAQIDAGNALRSQCGGGIPPRRFDGLDGGGRQRKLEVVLRRVVLVLRLERHRIAHGLSGHVGDDRRR